MSRLALALTLTLAVAACSSSSTTAELPPGDDPSTRALLTVKSYIATNLDELLVAARELQSAAPAPDADGWNATADAAAVTTMKAAWRKARKAYEHVEGAIAVLFGELDESTDQRYDAFIESTRDDNLFDDLTVTGIHAVERILWVDSTPATVIAFERGLPNYVVAAYPANLQQASDFKTRLCARLVADVQMMIDGFKPVALDPAAAYRGVIGSLIEQREKITKAETGEEESRYAGETLADMRSNVEGGLATQMAFRAWLDGKAGGVELDARITAGFKRITDAYAATSDARLPPLPPTWNAASPSPDDLATPFGRLYGVLQTESDEANPDSLVSAMNLAADAMGIKAAP
jgi:iron uptake system component EfeO